MKKLLIIPLFFFSISVFGQFTKNQLYNGINLNIRNKGASQLRLANMLDSIVVSMGSGSGGSMVYPSAGIPLSTGSAWGTSIADNSANWNTTYGWGDHASAGYGILSADNTWTGNNAFTNNRVTVSGTTYTLLSSDWGKSIDFTNSSDVTVTLPDGFATGFNCSLYKQGTGDVIVTATTTLESNATPATITVLHAGAYVEHKGSNVWEATGQFGDPASGNMLESVYDPATIAEQLVGLTASQSLTNKSINGVTLNSAGSSSLFLNQAGGYTSPVSSFWSLATGGTLTGVNTITSNVNSGINFAGTWTATATSQAHANFGGTFTAFGGTPNILYGYRFNPTLVASGTSGAQVAVQINPSFSGGTSPKNVYLQVGNVTPIASFDFQAYTGYFSGPLRFDATMKDNRDNNFIQQSASGVTSNRTMTIGNSTYSTVDFVHAGTLQSSQSAVNTGVAPNAFKVIGGAHTNLTLSNSVVDVYFNIGRTVQSAAGTITNNRYVYIENPTHSFVGASTSSREVTVAIKGSPIAGTNATFTNSIGLEVESANVAAGTATSYAAYFNVQTGATNNYGIGVTGGINFTGALMPSGSAGTSGYFLQSAGAGATPTWTNQGQSKLVAEGSYSGGSLVVNTDAGGSLSNGEGAKVVVVVVCTQSSGTPGASAFSLTITGMFRKSGGTITEVGSDTLTDSFNDTGDSFSGTPNLVVSGGTINLDMNLSTSKTFDYKFVTTVIKNDI